jgi:hypothetical protein
MLKFVQPYIDKLNSWNRKRKYKRDVYYRIAHNANHTGIMPIELIKGPFKGIIYSYGAINIGDDLGYVGAQASFDIDIIRGEQNLLQDVEFSKLVGDILLVTLEEALSLQAEKMIGGLDEEIGEDYIEEPVPQRTVRKKDSAVSKKRVSTRKVGKKPVRRSAKVRSSVQPDTDL